MSEQNKQNPNDDEDVVNYSKFTADDDEFEIDYSDAEDDDDELDKELDDILEGLDDDEPDDPDEAVEKSAARLKRAEQAAQQAVKAKDMDGDGYVYDNTPQQRKATPEEQKGGYKNKNKMSKADALLETARSRQAKKLAKKKGGGGKKKVAKTDEQKAAEKEAKHAEKVKAQVEQIDQYTEQLQTALENLTAKKDFKDESNIKKRLGQAIERLKKKKARLADSRQNVDTGAEDLLSEAGTKALPKPYEETAWIGFYLSTHDAAALEDERLEDMGECEERMHLTLAMTGYLTEAEIYSIGFDLNQIAQRFKPLVGTVSGKGTFNTPDGDCLYASFDSPQLPALHEAVSKALENSMLREHGFTPHITLCYCEAGTDTSMIDVPNLELTLPMMTFAVGSTNYNYALGIGFVGEQDWSEAVEDDEDGMMDDAGDDDDEEMMDDDGMTDTPPAKAIPFFDFVGQKAVAWAGAGWFEGTITAIKRFGEYGALKATKENPIIFVDDTPCESTNVQVMLSE